MRPGACADMTVVASRITATRIDDAAAFFIVCLIARYLSRQQAGFVKLRIRGAEETESAPQVDPGGLNRRSKGLNRFAVGRRAGIPAIGDLPGLVLESSIL